MKARWIVVLVIVIAAAAGATGYWFGDSAEDAATAPLTSEAPAPPATPQPTEAPLPVTDTARVWCLTDGNMSLVIKAGTELGFRGFGEDISGSFGQFDFFDAIEDPTGWERMFAVNRSEVLRACQAAYELNR